MHCGVDCIAFLLKYYDYDEDKINEILTEAEKHVGDQGMSIYDFICITNQYSLRCSAVKSLWMPKQLPCVLYLKRRHKSGHFMMLVKKKRLHFVIYDPIVKYKRINKIKLYIFWSHICILCYNNEKRGT